LELPQNNDTCKVKGQLLQGKRAAFARQNLSFCKPKAMLLKKNGVEMDKNELLTSANLHLSKNYH